MLTWTHVHIHSIDFRNASFPADSASNWQDKFAVNKFLHHLKTLGWFLKCISSLIFLLCILFSGAFCQTCNIFTLDLDIHQPMTHIRFTFRKTKLRAFKIQFLLQSSVIEQNMQVRCSVYFSQKYIDHIMTWVFSCFLVAVWYPWLSPGRWLAADKHEEAKENLVLCLCSGVSGATVAHLLKI